MSDRTHYTANGYRPTIQDLTAKDIDVAAHSMEKGRDMSGVFEKKLVSKFGESREFQEWCALFAAKCCPHVHPTVGMAYAASILSVGIEIGYAARAQQTEKAA